MTRKKWWIIDIIVVVVVIIALIGGRNKVINAYEDVKLCEAQIETMIQRRNDLIPNLVSTVQGYISYEETVFTEIATSREKIATSIDNLPIDELAVVNTELSQALNKLLALVEDYPELKASEQFTNLQYEIAGSENRINIARINYNEAVMKYNKYIKSFPGILYAKFFGYEELPYFEAEIDAEDVPAVNFD